MAKRGLEGNFMAQPRVLAHSVLPITEDLVDNILPFTEGRGCALYIGGQEPDTESCDIVVRMEGTTNVGFGEEDIVVFRNVTPGSFLPILVTSVLESDAAFYEQRINYLEGEIRKAKQEVASLTTEDGNLKDEIGINEDLKKEGLRDCGKLPEPERPSCEDNVTRKYNLIIKSLEERRLEITVEINNLNIKITEKEDKVNEFQDVIDSGSTVQTSAINVLGLF